jgi:uncharacterized RDD family membrane protein YckC
LNPPAILLDTVRTFETPEGVALGIRVAGPLVRFLAWSLDLAIRAIVYTVMAIVLGNLGEAAMGVFLIMIFAMEWFYPVLFELFRNGQTPGKSALGIAVVYDNGTPVSLPGSLIRNLLRAADFLPFCYTLGLVSMLINTDFKRLGDLAAGTLVVYRDKPKRGREPRGCTPIALPVGLAVEEQQALVDFARRRPGWTDSRAQELAEILEPMTRESGKTGVDRLLGHAAWLLGHR